MNIRSSHMLSIAGLGLACVIVLALALARLPVSLEITMLDVGQGDALVVRTDAGHAILIDGGPDHRVAGTLSELLPPWQGSLSGVIVTHPDADHLTGILTVLDRYAVGWVGINGVVRDTTFFTSFVRALDRHNIPVVLLERGHQIGLGGPVLTVLHPKESTLRSAENINAESLVMALSDRHGNHHALLMGDAERGVEYQLLRDGLVPTVTALKVGHHGSRFGTGNALLRATQPEWALISAGANNSYGHPAETALARLRAAADNIVTTAVAGSVTLPLEY